jgi:esterase/lipase superfamily enzyme
MPVLIANQGRLQTVIQLFAATTTGCIGIILLSIGCSKPNDTAMRSQQAPVQTRAESSENATVGDHKIAMSQQSDPPPLVEAPRLPLGQHPQKTSTFDFSPAPPIPSASFSQTPARRASRSRIRAIEPPAPNSIQAPAANPIPAEALAPMAMAPAAPTASHLDHLPAGARHDADKGFATVEVFYATDRQRNALPMSAYEITGKRELFAALAGSSTLLICFGGVGMLLGGTMTRRLSLASGCVIGCCAAAVVLLGQANIEKHGASYNADRGQLVQGICEVTVPDSHQRGVVERPSLLSFEFREDSKQHIILTSAVELSQTDFERRLSDRVAGSDQQALLVFIHGYNVDFESAVQRTAQISVDLPFSGVPICYSWPSQGSLLGYAIDENNAIWTVTHLKKFLTTLAEESGARSINVVAHSMGNRALTDAIRQIDYQRDSQSPPLFDRVVLAAPDVDADHFRRDLAPSLLNIASQVTLYASSDDQALIASKQVHGYPRAGESGPGIVIVPGIETIDVSGIDLSLLGHSYYGDTEAMLIDMYDLIGGGLPASNRSSLIPLGVSPMVYWQLAHASDASVTR